MFKELDKKRVFQIDELEEELAQEGDANTTT